MPFRNVGRKMAQQLKFFIVEDDLLLARLMSDLMQAAGHICQSAGSGEDALREIPAFKPDCVLADLMMPGMDGIEFLIKLRESAFGAQCKVIIVSAKTYEADKKSALDAGASGFLNKPINAERFADDVMRIVEDKMELTFWGVRGTLPVPGERTVRYGGNTPCVSLSFATGQIFVFDAGSGITEFARHLMAAGKRRIQANIFFSHCHWDHINAFPFFSHLYVPGNDIRIYGPSQGRNSIRDLVTSQMDGVYFPITMTEFAAQVSFTDLFEGTFDVDRITVKSMLLNHPGNCLGYRVEYGGRSACYITDLELYPEDNPSYQPQFIDRLVAFIRGTDALVIDTAYFDREYPQFVNWGHSCVSEVCRLAHKAQVKKLCLFHHDPGQDDDAIDRKLADAKAVLAQLGSAVQVMAPAEKDVILL